MRLRFEKECQALQKDSKAYWDAMRGKHSFHRSTIRPYDTSPTAMTSSQSRIAETIEAFYSSDHTSEGAMSGHAYKRSVDDLDTGFGRELVCHTQPNCRNTVLKLFTGRSISHYHIGTPGQDVCLLSRRERAYNQAEQESTSRIIFTAHLVHHLSLVAGL